MMIREFIEQQNITDVKESQFRYRLKKEHESLVEQGHSDEVLFSVGLVQRKKTTRDFVYLFSPLVLECVYKMIKDIATARAEKKAALATEKADKKAAAAKKPKKVAADKQPKKIARKAKSGPSGDGSKSKGKPKNTRHKKPPE
jgi:ribosomal protein L29